MSWDLCTGVAAVVPHRVVLLLAFGLTACTEDSSSERAASTKREANAQSSGNQTTATTTDVQGAAPSDDSSSAPGATSQAQDDDDAEPAEPNSVGELPDSSADDDAGASGELPGTAVTNMGDPDPPTPNENCGSTKWACWPMPNPAGSGLPNEASYTDNGDGTVTDDVTGLQWEAAVNSGSLDWQGCVDYCDGLSLGGFDDWRAPSRVEMTSIVDYSQRGTKVDPSAFPDAPGAWHRTASVWILTIDGRSDLDVAWTFNLSDGIVSNNFNRADEGSVRCVRSARVGEAPDEPARPPPDQYTLLSDEQVRDEYTGLIWQRGDSREYLTWADAVAYCQGLELGAAIWRLPSIRELATLVDEATVAPSINREVFPDTIGKAHSNDWYWASHEAADGSGAWAINFDDGFTGYNRGAEGAWNGFTAGYARCVR